MRKTLLILFSSLMTMLGLSQSIYSQALTLESIFRDRGFESDRMGAMQWLPDGKSYSVVENGTIYKIDIESGLKSVLVPVDLEIESYQFTADLSDLIIFTNSQRVWRYNTKGDYYHLNMQSGKLSKIAPDVKPSSLQFAKLSPAGGKVAYVYMHNIYIQDLATAEITQLTHDGTEEIINGTFDWAYEEEFDCRDGFRWSPDGSKIAFWQIDASGIGLFNMINYTDSIYSQTIPLQYPKVGTTISAAKIGVVEISSGQITWMNIEGDPRDQYIPFMDWADNSSELLIQRVPRSQTYNHVTICNASTGECREIFRDGSPEYWVDVNSNIVWFNKGKEFLWLGEEDGWKHIYMVSRDGKSKRLITKGDYDVLYIDYIDRKNGHIFFTSSLEDPTMRFLYRIDINRERDPVKILPQYGEGTNSFRIAPGARYAIHSYSSAGIPTKVNLVDLRQNRVIQELVTNDKLCKKLENLKMNPQEFSRVEIEDGVLLDCYMIKPANFNPEERYPVIFHVYGEPFSTTVTDSWGGSTYLFHQYLAQNGFLIVSVENRGTPVPRGRDFRKHAYKKIGINAPEDQAKAVKKILQEYSYIDPERVGVWGWSGGGSMTLNALLKYPELYKTGVAVASVPDQLLYNAFYQERYMLHPKDNPEGYYEGSPVNFAKNLEGNLLLIHGTGDDNVHYQGAERLINEFIRYNKQFDMFIYPNRSHGISEGIGTSLHLRELIFNYFINNL